MRPRKPSAPENAEKLVRSHGIGWGNLIPLPGLPPILPSSLFASSLCLSSNGWRFTPVPPTPTPSRSPRRVQATAAVEQLGVLQNQLEQMKSSSDQTNKIIEANTKLALAAQKSADTADKNLVATQRAWVGPIDASIISSGNGTVIKGTVSYINSGREPARFSGKLDESVYSREDWDNGSAANNIIARQQECLVIKYIDGSRFVWPTVSTNIYFIHFPAAQIPQVGIYTWNDRIVGGQDILAIQGCLSYIAFGEIHHTSYCYFYDSRASDVNHLSICTVGNDVN